MPKKYKVTIDGPRFSVGEKVFMGAKVFIITRCSCSMVVTVDEYGKRFTQLNWYCEIQDIDDCHNETIAEYALTLLALGEDGHDKPTEQS